MQQREFVRHLRQTMTESENALWRRLRAHRLNGEKFRRQQPIGPYVVDFVHFGARLIIEADGGQHNGAPRDEIRDEWLRAQGFRVMRFWNNEIMGNLDGVLEVVMAAVNESPPLPYPSPARGEEKTTEPASTGSHDTRSSHEGGEGENVLPPQPESPSPLAGEGLGRGGNNHANSGISHK